MSTDEKSPWSAPRRPIGERVLPWLTLTGLVAGLFGGELVYRSTQGATRTAWIDNLSFVGTTLFLGRLRALLPLLVIASILRGIGSLTVANGFGKLVTRTVALLWGLMIVGAAFGAISAKLINPPSGVNLDPATVTQVADATGRIASSSGLGMWGAVQRMLTDITSTNPITAIVEGKLLSLVAFSLVLGIALASAGQAGRGVLDLAASLFAGLMRLVGWILCLAPIGVAALSAAAVARLGVAAVIGPLAVYAVTVVVALLGVALIILPLLLFTMTGRNAFAILWAMRPALFTAFSTASSGATIPVTLRCAPDAGIDPRVAQFVIPFGTAGQLVGTATFQATAIVFLYHSHGIPLGAAEMLLLVVATWLASMSCAGIPAAAIVAMVVVIESVNGIRDPSAETLPITAIAMILAVDRLADMLRTTVNVWAHVIVAGVVGSVDRGAEAGSPSLEPGGPLELQKGAAA